MKKTGLTLQEIGRFQEVGENIWIPYDTEKELYLEDEKYLARRAFPIELLKPTSKRIIDSTLPYEALPLYQVTKQADVVQMMNLLPNQFSTVGKKKNFDFYLKRTAHDSSLSICGYGLMAARIGDNTSSESLFKKALFFDIDDRLLNTISGLHFANFGGVWQILTLGFFGIEFSNDTLTFSPHMPNYLEEIKINIYYRQNQFSLTLSAEKFSISAPEIKNACSIKVNHTTYHLTEKCELDFT